MISPDVTANLSIVRLRFWRVNMVSMTDSGKDSTGGQKVSPTKQDRLSAALRENLKRRKAQARQREADVQPENAATGASAPASKTTEKDKN